MPPVRTTSPPEVLSVAQVTRRIKDAVEGNFPLVYVQGEISNCTRAGSGHVYLTLKDDDAQLRGVLWRHTASRLRFEIHDGLEVIAAGPIEVYEARGTYQIVIEQLVPQGIGALELAFRQLCARLEVEGLFAAERKRPLPRFPRRIALVTSPSGAAVRDMLQVITRRWPAADIVIVPVPVQGAGAAPRIAQALASVHRLPRVDVAICGRGGGSLEDLWAFNEEIVARALLECRVPVVSAVGHEIDVTVADLVADRRALTPSEAGELVVPQRDEVREELRRCRQRLSLGLAARARAARSVLDALSSRRLFARPYEQVREAVRRVDEVEQRLRRAARSRLGDARQAIASLSAALHALSPLGVLERGYSLTRRVRDGAIVREASAVVAGEAIETRLDAGSIISRVETTLEAE